MRNKSIALTILSVTLASIVFTLPAYAVPDPNAPNRYLNAVREFADSVLQHIRRL
jgi:hypothetical protein